MEKSCRRQCSLDSLERCLAVLGPNELLWASFQGVEEVVEMGCSMFNEPPVVVDHAQKCLKLLDRLGRRHFGDGLHSFWQRCDAFTGDPVAQEVERGLPQDALCPVDGQSGVVENLEDAFEILQVFLGRRRSNQNVV